MFYFAMEAATQNIHKHKYTNMNRAFKTLQVKHIKVGNEQKRSRKHKRTRSMHTSVVCILRVATRRFRNSSLSRIGTRYVCNDVKDEKFVHFTR